jgi:formylglycine-generating enzyme required for sulfatase activity
MYPRERRFAFYLLGTSLLTTALLVYALRAHDAGAWRAAPKKPALGEVYVERIANNPDFNVFPPNPQFAFEMVYIPGGTFEMGSPEGEPGRQPTEGPRHSVTVEPVWMGKYEVNGGIVQAWISETSWSRWHEPPLSPAATRAASVRSGHLYMPVCDGDPRTTPAVTFTCFGAQEFCRWLTRRTGRFYRLPTEAEWEYACRAGTVTAYHFGNNATRLSEYAWFGSGAQQIHAIGKLKPNPWGLYDMYGNAGEWVLDDWSDSYSAADGAHDPWRRRKTGNLGVIRGGDWSSTNPAELRSASRRRGADFQEINGGSFIFNHDPYGGRRPQTGLRLVAPVSGRSTDGREASVPAPKSPWEDK